MRWPVLAAVVALGALVAMPAPSEANGRAPLTNGITFKPGDDQSIYLATTFGLLISHDDGCTFRWVCEQNIGYGGQWDPKYGIAMDGTIFATTFEGLRVSRDGGCSFTTATSELAASDPNRIADIWIDALDIGPTGEVWVGTAETGHTNDVFVSADNGFTFSSRGLLSTEVWYKSVKVAPSNAQRVYATGYKVAGTPTAYFYISDNDGTSWTPSPLANVMYAATPVLLVKAIDPTNPDIVFMTSIGANTPSGDLLYRSTDGGTTWTQVLATTASIHDVVISGQTVTVATQIESTMALMGGPAYQSTNGGVDFAALGDAPQLACVAARPDGTLLGCGANWDPDFKAVARSIDKGASWTKVWRFVEIAGAVQCAPGTVEHDTCDATLWNCPTCMTDLKRQFGAKGPACGATTDVSGDTTKKPGGGCCDAGSSGPAAAMWSIVVGLFLLRRRRGRC
ncbi:MAG TPA: sialidase family protein [Kofleriaceae bacterium]|nr:sialidase family protein [Kofleriaceae bacterium]